MNQEIEIPEEDVIMLEALLKSPVYAAFKRLIGRYKDGSMAMLMQARETNTIYEARGHIRGLELIDNLPTIIVKQRQDRLKRETDAKEAAEKNRYKSPFPLPELPEKSAKKKKV